MRIYYVYRFADLSPAVSQFGIDDLSTSALGGSAFCSFRHEEADVLLDQDQPWVNALAVRRFLRRGAPPSLRGKLW